MRERKGRSLCGEEGEGREGGCVDDEGAIGPSAWGIQQRLAFLSLEKGYIGDFGRVGR